MEQITNTSVCVVGLGYVGVPLLANIVNAGFQEVHGFDIDADRVANLHAGYDYTGMVPDKIMEKVSRRAALDVRIPEGCDVYIVAVPTPDDGGNPDYTYIDAAARSVGGAVREGSMVIIESTVAPGTTMNRIRPIIEEAAFPKSFDIAYSPERINPSPFAFNDMVECIKVVACPRSEALPFLEDFYNTMFQGTYCLNDPAEAELAKVFENTQRDVNIALMNELSLHSQRKGVNYENVVAALRTKTSSPRFSSGLVGGHCIPVDPYYLQEWYGEDGLFPSMGRGMNELFIRTVATLPGINVSETGIPRVLIIGKSYKRHVVDTRNSGAMAVHDLLMTNGIPVEVYDPLYDEETPLGEYGYVIGAVNHYPGDLRPIKETFNLTIDCTFLNIDNFSDDQLEGIDHIITM